MYIPFWHTNDAYTLVSLSFKDWFVPFLKTFLVFVSEFMIKSEEFTDEIIFRTKQIIQL